MGVSISQEEAQNNPPPTTGFHVLRVKEGSPAELCGMEPFFDYIVAADGIRLDEQNLLLLEILKKYLDQELTLILFNSKSQEFRETVIVPTNKWGGEGLLGCSIRFCNFEHAAEHVWHVMEVYPDSPASHAGLRPHHDYIIGTPEVIIKDKNDLFLLVDQHIGKPLRFYVYNWETDKTREHKIAIIPDPKWGGEGCLGCDIGFGYLHRIPRVRAPPQINQSNPDINQEITLADLGSVKAVSNQKVSESSLMTASDSMVSLPDVLPGSSPKKENRKGNEDFLNVELKVKSANASKVSFSQ